MSHDFLLWRTTRPISDAAELTKDVVVPWGDVAKLKKRLAKIIPKLKWPEDQTWGKVKGGRLEVSLPTGRSENEPVALHTTTLFDTTEEVMRIARELGCLAFDVLNDRIVWQPGSDD